MVTDDVSQCGDMLGRAVQAGNVLVVLAACRDKILTIFHRQFLQRLQAVGREARRDNLHGFDARAR